MIQRISDRLHREDKGFTLIELMVVVLIIAILIAIAIPTFLGARKRAQDRAAQSSARNTVTAAKAIFTDNEDYTDATTTKLTEGEPSLSFVAAGTNSTEQTMVSVTASDANNFFAAVYSKAGNCWFVRDRAGPSGAAEAGTYWNKATSVDGAGCNATAGAALASGWARNVGDL